MSEERRRASRIRSHHPVRLHRSGTLQVIETLTKDLAPGGLRCVSPTVLPIASEVTVELPLSPGEEPITARARTVWFRAMPESEQFDLGIAFLDLPPQTARRLSAYMDRHAETVQSSR